MKLAARREREIRGMENAARFVLRISIEMAAFSMENRTKTAAISIDDFERETMSFCGEVF